MTGRGDASGDHPPVSLAQVFWLFLRLGVTAFGGPAAHIALLHDEVVRRRKWITDRDFGELIALTNLIPGPNSTEMAIHVGRRVAGWAGFFIAGACFIVPAALMVGGLAVLYTRYGTTPDARALLWGVTPVVVAIVAHAVVQLSLRTLQPLILVGLAVVCALLALFGVNELVLLAAAGTAMLLLRSRGGVVGVLSTLASIAAVSIANAPIPEFSLTRLALFFLKVGSVLFGSGYVLLAFLRTDLVERWGWLTDQQLIDAVAAGQITPGPLFTSATFVGYLLGGWTGAALATAAIFAPAFAFVALTGPLFARLKNNPAFVAFLSGVLAASLGLMAAVAVELGRAVVGDLVQLALLTAALLALMRWKVNAALLIVAGASAGILRAVLGS